MAHPSSSHRDRDDDRGTIRERTHRSSSSSSRHRTISSTTLLLVLSLILAVLAVMLSLPSRSGGVLTGSRQQQQAVPETGAPDADGASHSFWGYLTPKRSHALVSRESAVAMREAEVARREAELLAARPGGWPLACPPCAEHTVVEEFEPTPPSISLVSRASPPAPPPAVTTVIQEVIKEVIKEVEPSNPAWLQTRIEGLVEREMKLSDREKDVGRREEAIGRREADSTKREAWIMEQLQNLNPPEPPVVEDDYGFDEHPRHYYGDSRRPPKELPSAETIIVTETEIRTKFQPAPAPTRVAARPTPETFITSPTGAASAVTQEIFIEIPTGEITVELPQETVTVVETVTAGPPPLRGGPPRKKWFGPKH
ncbi:hypothetical protein FRB99_006201 [Tulasnella sp. 403]|nr:hypothetical protein FRB99_006201 [Tulasnella sp. 403]